LDKKNFTAHRNTGLEEIHSSLEHRMRKASQLTETKSGRSSQRTAAQDGKNFTNQLKETG
jgi:hypothetical protein